MARRLGIMLLLGLVLGGVATVAPVDSTAQTGDTLTKDVDKTTMPGDTLTYTVTVSTSSGANVVSDSVPPR